MEKYKDMNGISPRTPQSYCGRYTPQ